jgi:hypothetical protein
MVKPKDVLNRNQVFSGTIVWQPCWFSLTKNEVKYAGKLHHWDLKQFQWDTRDHEAL